MTKTLTIGIYLVAVLGAADVAVAAVALKDARDNRALLAADQRRRDDEAKREKEALTPKDVALRDDCYANGFSYICTFTNMNPTPATSKCSHGRLAQKENPGVTLLSMTVCSGVLASKETKQVSGPWLGGEPEAVCNRPNGLGGTTLDWSKCVFDVVPDQVAIASASAN